MKMPVNRIKQSNFRRSKLVILMWITAISVVIIGDNLSDENLRRLIDPNQWDDFRRFLLLIFGILTGIVFLKPGNKSNKPETTKFCSHCYAENPIEQEICLDCENEI